MLRRSLLPAALGWPALAQDRPVRMIVPFAPGGAADGFARRLANRMQAPLGQPVLVENREGAAGATGALEVVRARPDGQTILFGTASSLCLYSLMVERPQFDPLTDLAPVSLVGAAVVAFAARPDTAPDLAGLVAAAGARPGTLRIASPGGGSYIHLATEMMKRAANGMAMPHVPLSSAPAMAALLSGEIAAASDLLANLLDHHRAGRIRILAVASAQRTALVPDVPTVAEALNLPSFETALWMAVMLPNGTAPGIRDRLAYAINSTLADANTRAELVAKGFEVGALLNPAQMAAFMRAEQARWRPVVQATGARLG